MDIYQDNIKLLKRTSAFLGLAVVKCLDNNNSINIHRQKDVELRNLISSSLRRAERMGRFLLRKPVLTRPWCCVLWPQFDEFYCNSETYCTATFCLAKSWHYEPLVKIDFNGK